jgi:cytochrome c biogenesis protein CcmG/thiol:disulfide interchange protein DsbE
MQVWSDPLLRRRFVVVVLISLSSLVALTVLFYGVTFPWLKSSLRSDGLVSSELGFAVDKDHGNMGGRVEMAPDFHLPLLVPYNGQIELRLSDLRGRPVLVNFWASWCPPCREEMPAFQRVWKKYSGEGLMIVGVALQDTEDAATAFVHQVGVTYPVGMDMEGDSARGYNVTALPMTFFLDRDGNVASAWTGTLSEEELERFVVDLLRR